MPHSTLYSWLRSNHRESVVSVSHCDRALNFLQLSEAFAIAYMRKTLKIPLSKIREASEYLRKNLRIRYPLINPGIRVGTDVYFKHAKGVLLNASRYGQVESEDLIDKYINRIEFGEEKLPDVLYPWIPGQEKKKNIRIDPRIRFGRPTISGTGIAVSVVRNRYKAGESLEEIAAGYGISPIGKVEDAIAYATC